MQLLTEAVDALWNTVAPITGRIVLALLLAGFLAGGLGWLADRTPAARRRRADETALWRASQRRRQEDADRVPDDGLARLYYTDDYDAAAEKDYR